MNTENQNTNQQPTVSEPIPVVEPPKVKIKWLIPVVSLILGVVIGIGGLLAYQKYFAVKPVAVASPSPVPSQTSDPTTNWKTLINTFGFSIKYPQSFKVLGEGMQVDETNAPIIEISSNPGDPNNNSSALRIDISPKEMTVYKNLTLAQIAQDNYEANQANINTFKGIITPIKKTTLDGQPAYTYSIKSNGFSGKWGGWPVNASLDKTENLTIIETENSGNYYIIVLSANDPTLHQILSTFKFTDTVSSVPKPISDLFDSINKKFSLDLKPIAEDNFYSPQGEIAKKSWKIDFLKTGVGKDLMLFLDQTLTPNYSKSGEMGGGGIDAYENDTIECYYSYFTENYTEPGAQETKNYLTCALK